MQLALLVAVTLVGAEPAEDLLCLQPAAGEPPASQRFYAALQQRAYAALDRRQAAYDQLKSPEDIAAYQKRLRTFFVQQLGGLAERTPLNGQVVGRMEADGYRLEKIIFESRPNHHVTATLYLPLEAGTNRLEVVVADGFGGWGLMGRFRDPAGLEIAAR